MPTEPPRPTRRARAGPAVPRAHPPNRSSGSATTSKTSTRTRGARDRVLRQRYRAADLLMGLHNRQTAGRISALAECTADPRGRRGRRRATRTERHRRAAPHHDRLGDLAPRQPRKARPDTPPAPPPRPPQAPHRHHTQPRKRSSTNSYPRSTHANANVMSGALSTNEQRELLRLIAKLQHAALQAQSTPAPHAAARQRAARLHSDMATMKGIAGMTPTVAPTTEATTPPWRGINHLALITTDMDATVRFYHGTLGARLVATIGTPEFRHYFFKFGPQCTVAFFEYAGRGNPSHSTRQPACPTHVRRPVRPPRTQPPRRGRAHRACNNA